MAFFYRFMAYFLIIVLSYIFILPSQTIWQEAGLGGSAAYAQQKKKRKSLFSILFGRKKAKKKKVRVKKRTKKSVVRRSKRLQKRKAVALAPLPEAVEKREDAKKILIVGDFFAGGMADGLEKAFAAEASIRVVNHSNGLSGFIRTDVVNWPEKLPTLIAEIKPAYVVAMLGSNDRQLMRENGKKLKKRTQEWDKAYQARVENFAAVLKEAKIPFTYMGLPPVRFKSMNKDFLFFNETYRNAVEKADGEYVDIWDGFSDANGNYTRSGPDVSGQIVLLRRKDGINLTNAGKARLAFYIQNKLLKRLKEEKLLASRDFERFFKDTKAANTVLYDPAKTGKTIVIHLDDPAYEGADVLAGAPTPAHVSKTKASALALEKQERLENAKQKKGRADNFAWPLTQNNSEAFSSAFAVGQ